MKIFLGGTCVGRDWRSEIIPHLKCEYFNPVVKDWNEESKKKEIKERETSDYVLYVVTPDMKGVYSIAEVVDDSNKRPSGRTLFAVLDMNKFDSQMQSSLKEIKNMVSRNGGLVFASIESLIGFLKNIN